MRYGLDILMFVLLVGEMAFFYLPPLVHEAVGVAFLLPILWHLVLNRRYVSSLGRGRWNGPRGVRFALNVLLASACLVTVISGCLTSSVLFADIVPFSLRSNPSLYQLHGTAAHYFLVLAGLHLGWHLPAWWQRWLHAAGITARPLPARMLLLGLGGAARGGRHLRGAAGPAHRAPAGRACLHGAGALVQRRWLRAGTGRHHHRIRRNRLAFVALERSALEMNRREFLKMGGMSVMALVLGGCGLSSLTGSSSNGQAANSAASGVAASSSGTVAAGGKTLVVYYSATGRTERVAKVIAKERQADIMKLVPNPDYTEADLDYNDKSSRVSREHDDASLRDKIQLQKAVPDNWASYDTIFLGYPIWWSIAAWPVDAFVKANDFTGKNVVTFATAGVSPLGNSGKLLAEMAGGKGNWQDGTCFTGSLDDAKVQEWVRSLNLAK